MKFRGYSDEARTFTSFNRCGLDVQDRELRITSLMPAIDRAVAAFTSACGARPTLVARAPGRVNLIGEHLDYNGGHVLPFAIDLDCVVVMGLSESGLCRVQAVDVGGSRGAERCAEKIEVSVESVCAAPALSLRQLGMPHHWTSYVLGVLFHMRPLLAAAPAAFDMVIATDVPLGGGLSSSASLEVAIARGMLAWTGSAWDAHAAALACQRAEHEFAGVPCGLMDQLVSSSARAGHALRIDCTFRHTPEHIPMPRAEDAVVLVIDSGVRHTLAASEFGNRVATCKAAAEKIGLANLADLVPEQLAKVARHLSATELRAARHVCMEQQRVVDAATAMRADDVARLGTLMVESHRSLRDDYRVSCEELDVIVESAMGVAGVYGARMTGGGFGGCAIALVKPSAIDELRRRVGEDFKRRFGREPRMFQTNASAGASIIEPAPLS